MKLPLKLEVLLEFEVELRTAFKHGRILDAKLLILDEIFPCKAEVLLENNVELFTACMNACILDEMLLILDEVEIESGGVG